MRQLEAIYHTLPNLGVPLISVGSVLLLFSSVLLLFFGIHWTLTKSGLLKSGSAIQSSTIIKNLLRYGLISAVVLIVAGIGLGLWKKRLAGPWADLIPLVEMKKNISTDNVSNDEQVKREVRRIYNEEANQDIHETVKFLKQDGFSCTKSTLADYDFWCDYQRPYILSIKRNGSVEDVVLTFRRQISLSKRDHTLELGVKTGVIAP